MSKKAVLAALAVGVAIPAVVVPMNGEVKAAEFSGFTYKGNGDGTATITGYSDTASKDVVIPDEIDGLTVTKIHDDAFTEKKIKTVSLPKGLKVIGTGAFSDNLLETVEFPEGTVEIGWDSFRGNKLKGKIIFPNSLKVIRQGAFWKNSLEEVELQGNIETVGSYPFMANKIKKVVFKEGIKTIGSSMFSDNLIEEVIIPDSVEKIESSAFYKNKIKRVVIPKLVTSIGANAFGSNNISEIQIPSSVTTLPATALDNNQFVPSYLKVYGQGGSRAHALAIEKGYTFNDGDMPNPPSITPPVVEPEPEQPTPEEPGEEPGTETPETPSTQDKDWTFADSSVPFKGVKPTITLVGGKPANDIVITGSEWVTEETTVTTPQGDLTFRPDGKGNTLVSAKTGLGDKKTATTINVEYEGTHFMNVNIKPVPELNFNFEKSK